MGTTPFPEGVSSMGMPVNTGIPITTGTVIFVHYTKGHDTKNDGLDPSQPLKTADAAVAKCTPDKGDVIVLMPGHSETLTIAVDIDIAGISLIGLGNGRNRPTFTTATTIDMVDVGADDVLIENIYFAAGTGSHTSAINSAKSHTVIKNCEFNCGAYSVESITLESGANFTTIEGNTFTVTANGPVAAIEVEAASTNLIIRNNMFNSGASTNAWDTACINSDAVPLAVLIDRNIMVSEIKDAGAEFCIFTDSTTGVISENRLMQDGGTFTTMIDPGSMGDTRNFLCNDIDESSSRVVTTTST